jgi:hypothetical protein
VAEAVAAAQALTPDLEQQVDITAGLMGLTPDEARPFVLEAPPLNLPRSALTQIDQCWPLYCRTWASGGPPQRTRELYGLPKRVAWGLLGSDRYNDPALGRRHMTCTPGPSARKGATPDAFVQFKRHRSV